MCSLHQINEFIKTKCLKGRIFLLACVLICRAAADSSAANMRSFIESVRRKAPVVYVGSVKEVRVLQQTKFDIEAKAVVDVKTVMRSPKSIPSFGDDRVFKL